MAAALSLGASALTAASSSGISTLPRPSSRSGMPKRRSRGTSGGGFIMKMSYCSKRCSKAISIESRKPSVTTRAVFAPLRSMIALVASVVPWMISPRSPGLAPDCFRISAMPVMTPSSGAREVVSTFTLERLPFHSRNRSVKVPPISTANRAFSIVLCRRLLDVAAEIGLADARIGAHLGRRAFHEKSSLLHDQGAVGDQQCAAHVLFDHQDGDAGRRDPLDGREYIALHARRQAERGLVEQQQAGLDQQHHRHFEDLLLAARQIARFSAPLLAQQRKQAGDPADRRLVPAAGQGVATHLEILFHAHGGEIAAALRHEADTALQPFPRRQA